MKHHHLDRIQQMPTWLVHRALLWKPLHLDLVQVLQSHQQMERIVSHSICHNKVWLVCNEFNEVKTL